MQTNNSKITDCAMSFFYRQPVVPDTHSCLPGRETPMPVPSAHYVNGHPMHPPFPDGLQHTVFAMGCFWGAEKMFWQTQGVFSTAVGYAGGSTPHPLYEEVCSGMTGHTEAILVVFDPQIVCFEQLLALFWEGHDPTQGMRQGNDVGTQYRSAIYWQSEEQRHQAEASLQGYQDSLERVAVGSITTELLGNQQFYYAEHYHQQYLAKEPNGYCTMTGTGVCYTKTKSL